MRTLYAANMGMDTHGEVDGIKTDIPSYRVRVAFKNRYGKVVMGDFGCYRVWDEKKRLAGIRIADSLCFLKTRKVLAQYGVEIDQPWHYAYQPYRNKEEGTTSFRFDFTVEGMLEFVNGLIPESEEPYDRVEFVPEGWEKWESIPEVLALKNEFDAEERRLNEVMRGQYREVERLKEEEHRRWTEYLANRRKAV